MSDKKCGIAQLCELAMIPQAVTVVTGRPVVGRTTLLVAMARYAAKNGDTVIYATNDEIAENTHRRFAGMGAEAAARLRVNNYQTEAICDVDAALTVLDANGVTPENFDAIVRMVKAPGVNAATIVALPKFKPACGSISSPERMLEPEYAADVLISLSRDENRTDAHVVATVVKHRFEKPGQRFVFRFTPNGLAEAT